jgi:hypothetical protein
VEEVYVGTLTYHLTSTLLIISYVAKLLALAAKLGFAVLVFHPFKHTRAAIVLVLKAAAGNGGDVTDAQGEIRHSEIKTKQYYMCIT